MKNNILGKWGLWVLLAIIWGSSFKLMLLGMGYGADFFGQPFNSKTLSAWQLGAFRMFWAGLFMLPFAIKAFYRIPIEKRFYVILSGFLGSFFPAFLFCLAETKLEGSFVGTLNSLTPIFVLIVGFLFFALKPTKWQVLGIVISFIGSIWLYFSKTNKVGDDVIYVGFVLLGTVFYGLNVNMVGKKLKEVASLDIAAVAFGFLVIPSAIVLLLTGTHQLDFSNSQIKQSVIASGLLGLLGTTVASILFYRLLKIAGGIFASTVTYGIPFVALVWGFVDGEKTNLFVWLSLCLILSGIVIANRRK
jgi:drug/metabolite transporter (DMT)-like permease